MEFTVVFFSVNFKGLCLNLIMFKLYLILLCFQNIYVYISLCVWEGAWKKKDSNDDILYFYLKKEQIVKFSCALNIGELLSFLFEIQDPIQASWPQFNKQIFIENIFPSQPGDTKISKTQSLPLELIIY